MQRPDIDTVRREMCEVRDDIEKSLETRLRAQAVIDVIEYALYLESHWWHWKTALDLILRGPHE